MIPVLYPANETTFANNGLGGLPDAISCVVTEQRNTPGGYWLEMEYPVDGLHYSDIAPDRIIYAAPSMGNSPQPFRISRITRPINGIVHIEAPHVSAELQKLVSFGYVNVFSPVVGFNFFKNEANRLFGLDVPFEFSSDILKEKSVTLSADTPTSIENVVLGSEGSILDIFGGEYEFDNRRIVLHNQRGVDTGIEIRYGVNMSDLNAETDATELVTAVIPFWQGNVNDTETVVIGSMCTASNASAFAYVRCVPLDVTQEFQQMEQGQQPTAAQVTAKGQAFIDSTSQSELSMSINVKYTPTTLGIGDRRINLCDTVRVVHPDLHLSSTAKVVKTKYNTLVEQYDELTIGSIQKTIVDTVAKLIGG